MSKLPSTFSRLVYAFMHVALRLSWIVSEYEVCLAMKIDPIW